MMLSKIHTDRNVVGMLTKVILSGKFGLCTRLVGLSSKRNGKEWKSLSLG